MVKTFKISIPSLTGEKKRKAYVYLPTNYYKNSKKRFPVLYMFDGHNLFSDQEATYGKCWGLADYLDYTDTQIIVVGVECNTVGNGRLMEYSPVNFTMPNGDKIKGQGKKYMDWLVGDFKGLIDKRFRTLKDRKNTFIGGSSMGGLMTLYAISKYNKYFSKGAALSPSLWVKGQEVLPFINTGKFEGDTTVYMDYGSNEFSNHEAQRVAFFNTATALGEKGVFVTARVVPYGNHSEASWERQVPVFFKVLGL
ncbi:MAG: alpha/beta hydrolase [Clostridiales bacterium]|nr:alpha/beta hydrolase [Clostridiales bacterium]